jgi:hypothetical protein
LKNIFFGIPVRNKKESIFYYLGCLYNLNYNKKHIGVYFLINDNSDNITDIAIEKFRKKVGNEYMFFHIEERNYGAIENTRSRNIEHYSHLTTLRNIVREKFNNSNCQYWLQVDADNMFRRNDLMRLLSHDKGFISGWVEHPWQYYGMSGITNILIKEKSGKYRRVSDSDILDKNEIFKVDWVGGISLIRRDISSLCNYYSPVINRGGIRSYNEENLGFCLDVQRTGNECWVDPEVKSYHIMGENQISEWSEGVEIKKD